MKKRISSKGLDDLIGHEGKRSKMYLDVARLPTIGVGHLLTKDELSSGKILIGRSKVRWHEGLSDYQIKKLLEQDAKIAQDAINQSVKAKHLEQLRQGHFDVLVSFVFNVGVTAFKNSTLLKRINAGRYKDVPDQLKRWNISGGKVRRGLVIRRAKEAEAWINA